MQRGHRERRQSRGVVWTRVVIAAITLIIMMFPIYWMLRTSVATTDELSALPVRLWPQEWHWDNYRRPWLQYPFARWLANSLVIAVTSAGLTLIINLAAGYAFAKLRFPLRDVLFLLIISTLMIPVQVIMVPQFQVVIDLRIFWSVVLPLSGPLIAALVIFTFMWRWNEFVWPLIVLTDSDAYTLPVGLQFLISQFGSDFGPLLAMSFLSILPMLLAFALFQKYFVQRGGQDGPQMKPSWERSARICYRVVHCCRPARPRL